MFCMEIEALLLNLTSPYLICYDIVGPGTARGGRLACTEETQIGSNPIGSTNI